MHQVTQPDGYTVTNWQADDRSGLIWPEIDGWAYVTCKVNLTDAGLSQILGRIVRDPLEIGAGKQNDWTGTDGRPGTPGGEHLVWNYQMGVNVGTPLAFQVRPYGEDATIVHSQFKISIHEMATPEDH